MEREFSTLKERINTWLDVPEKPEQCLFGSDSNLLCTYMSMACGQYVEDMQVTKKRKNQGNKERQTRIGHSMCVSRWF